MATIYKRGRMWCLAYTFAGKRIQKSIGPSKQIAELAKKDIEVRIAKLKAVFPIEYKLSDWKNEFFPGTWKENIEGQRFRASRLKGPYLRELSAALEGIEEDLTGDFRKAVKAFRENMK